MTIEAFRDLGEGFELEFLMFLSSKLASGGRAYLQRFYPRNSLLFQEMVNEMKGMGFEVKYKKKRPARLYVERM